MSKSPEEIQQSTSELIQRYEAEKAAAEALSEKYRQAHMEKLKMGYVPRVKTSLMMWRKLLM